MPLLGLRDEHTEVVAAYDDHLARQATQSFLDDKVLIDAARAFATTAYEAHLRREKKRVFVDKNGRYYHVAPTLPRLFPSALRIWLQRNPLDVIASYKSTWGVTVADLFGPLKTPNSFDVTASFAALDSCAGQPGETFRIKYEDLVTRPQEVVTMLCDAMGLMFEPGMLNWFDNNALMSSYRASIFGDKKLHQESSIHPRSVDGWRDVLTPDEVGMTLRVLGRLPFMAMQYEGVLREATSFAGIEDACVTERGRLDEYLDALETFPQGNTQVLLDEPSLWPRAPGLTAATALAHAFQSVAAGKEIVIARLASIADERLHRIDELHEAAEETRTALERATADLLAKDAVIAELHAASEERLRQLVLSAEEAEMLRTELLRVGEDRDAKDEALNTLRATLAERLDLLVRTTADLHEKDRVIQGLAEASAERLQLIVRLTGEIEMLREACARLTAQLQAK
jgi:hypothetical protein